MQMEQTTLKDWHFENHDADDSIKQSKDVKWN